MDLDAGVVAHSASENKFDICYFGDKSIFGGAVQHQGDNLTGEGKGDDERISIDLAGVPSNVDRLAIVVTSFTGKLACVVCLCGLFFTKAKA